MTYELIIFTYFILLLIISYIVLNLFEIYNKYKLKVFPSIGRDNTFILLALSFLTTFLILHLITDLYDIYYDIRLIKIYSIANFNNDILSIKGQVMDRPVTFFFYFLFVSFFFLVLDSVCVMLLDYVKELIRDYLPNNSLFIYYYFFIFIFFFIIFVTDLYITYVI